MSKQYHHNSIQMDHLNQVLKVGSPEQIAFELANFFTAFGNEAVLQGELAVKQNLIEALFRVVRDPALVNASPLALQVMRIFTRDSAVTETQFNSDRIETLLHLAMLVGEEEAFMTENSQSFDAKIVVEAQKCISNLLSISSTVRRICCTNSCIEGIMLRLRVHPDPKLPQEVKYFDMVMLFLLTALCPEVRAKVQNEFHGLIYLMEAMDLILKNNAEYLAESVPNKNKRRSKGSRRGRKANQSTGNENASENGKDEADGRVDDTLVAYCLDDWEVNLAVQILKVLFNLTLTVDNRALDEFEEAHFFRLVSILHDLLLCDTKNPSKKEDLQSHTVNLLTNMPVKSYEELLSNIADLGKPENPEHEYDEMNMEVIAVLLKFLELRLKDEKNPTVRDRLTPILTVLVKASKSCSTTRKYLRYRILPPLKEEHQRPEVGDHPRNVLVRLMKSNTESIATLASHFLFVLCKENRNRLVKYVGYGNAAGLLAQQGAMGREVTANYSSDSDDSETEEYTRSADKVNPVIGCIQEETTNPMEGMTEEQKEYEANRLVNMIDQLQRTGIIQPCQIGEDGRPKPIDHVLQLQEQPSTSGAKKGPTKRGSNSDSE